MKFSFSRRAAARRRGVAIENVMMGLILVLVFAGMLYTLFSYGQRYFKRAEVQTFLVSAISEVRILKAEVGADRFHDHYGLNVTELYRHIIGTGAVEEFVDWDNGRYIRTLPHDGSFELSVQNRNLLLAVVYFHEVSSGAKRLCNAIAGVVPPDLNIEALVTEKDPDLHSGNLGTNYVIAVNDCEGSSMGISRVIIAYGI